jgi:hypothetical protein
VSTSVTVPAIVATAAAGAFPAAVTAASSGQATAATATAVVPAHAAHADAHALAVVATAAASALDAVGDQNFDAQANATAATATLNTSSTAATGSADAAAAALAATASTLVYDAVGQGSSFNTATAATATATAVNAEISTSVAVPALAATAAATGRSATPAATATATATAATATATAVNATGTVQNLANYTDDFNRANNTSLGANWTETGGDLGIISNQLAVQGTTASRRAAIWNTQTVTPYQSVQFTVGSAPNGTAVAGAVLRCNSAMTEMFIMGVYNGGWNLGRITGINGTYTAVGSGTVTIATNDVIRCQVDENNVWSVYINGVKNGSSYRDTTWGDSSHKYLGLFVQRVSTTNSHSVDNFVGKDVTPYSQFAADNFNRASLGANWTTRFGPLYLASNELSAVGLASEPISFAWYNTACSTDDQAAEAKIRWNSRNPQHSSMSVCVRADPASNHAGVHYWRVADKHGICMYSWDGTAFTAATGTADIVTTTKAAEGAVMRIEARGTVYTAFLDNVPQLQGTFTTAQVPLTNHYCGVHGEDDSAVSGGGEPPANLDDFAAYSIL